MEIKDIKARLDIITVLKHYGLKANRNNMLKCPFHEETEPPSYRTIVSCGV